MSEKLTQAAVIEKLRFVHKDNIDFSRFEYKTTKSKAVCICHKHSEKFEWRTSFSILKRGCGCPKCSGVLKSQDDVIKTLELKHPELDFSQFIYKTNKNKSIFICKNCGFKREANYISLMAGTTCKCYWKDRHIPIENVFNNLKNKCKNIDFSKFIYLGSKTKSTCICLKCGKEWQVKYEKLMANCGCPNCARNKKLNHKEAIEKLIIKNTNIDFSRFVYTGSQTKSICICKVCSYEWNTTFSELMSGKGCAKCYGNTKKSQEEALSILEVNSPDIDFSKFIYNGARNKSICICRICNHHWNVSFNVLTNLKCGCPRCKSTYYEKKIEKILMEHHMRYETEKTFESCRYKDKLRFDFYLNDYNMLVEYNGKQHFVEFPYTDLALIKMRDSIKKTWCLENDVKLIEVSNSPYKTKENISLVEFEQFLTAVTRARSKILWTVN